MKIIVLLAVVGAALANSAQFYKTADDYMDMEGVVRDPAKLKAMTDCFMDIGPCDPVSQSLKSIVGDSIARGCDRCNDAQKHLANTFCRGLFWRQPHAYKNFVDKFDPQGNYMANFMEAVKDY
uniref:Chemosensory protein 20 n=1 Tax=Pieris rapae TaxID=64459 RepID=A0A5B8GTQ5_PIERA|nr:chemosensory protein 20 [Pieris rapae]